MRERLNAAKATLQEVLDGTFDQLFGGSVAKHTYVDGLSDIDSLLIVNGSKLEDQTPTAILNSMERILRESFDAPIHVEHGRMAVTITYPDGMVLQLLPAIRTDSGLKVPAAGTDGWSHINPEAFTEALTRRNGECVENSFRRSSSQRLSSRTCPNNTV